MENDMYKPPYSIKEIKKYYPDKMDKLLKDPVHFWCAKTGIELIHKEPTLIEQKRIWNNWKKMPSKMKRKSDEKSIELFDKDNFTHNKEIMRESTKNKYKGYAFAKV